MPFKHGHFTRPGAVSSTGSKTPPASTPHEKQKGEPQSPHGGSAVEHVTKTHPGETQPHPTTGVHAFHGHHTGGGKYTSHTHHDGGDVETRQHPNASDMHNAMREALPDEAQQDREQGEGRDIRDGGMDFAESLGGVGGEQLG